MPRETQRRVGYIAQLFSVKIILRTLFAPWKQDIAAAQSKSLEDRMGAIVGNLVSRFVGFSIRVILLLSATFAILTSVIFGIILTIVWPILPFMPILFIVLGIL